MHDWMYRCRVERVVDGDTLDLEVDLGFRVYHRVRVRLASIDTPEVRGPEREFGLQAKAFVEEWVKSRDSIHEWPFLVATSKTGKYGRWLADLFVNISPWDQEATASDGVGLVAALEEAGWDWTDR